MGAVVGAIAVVVDFVDVSQISVAIVVAVVEKLTVGSAVAVAVTAVTGPGDQ